MSTSETITRTDLANILNEVLPSTHGIGITKGSWTSSGTSAYNVKVTSDLTLSKGLYMVTIHTPYVASGSGLVGLRINGTADSSCNIVAPANEYARGAFLVDLSAQSIVAGYSEGSQAVTYSALDRGGIEAVQLVRYTESPEADYIVEQGSSGIWAYRKWNSGIAECWGIYTFNFTSMTSWGSGTYYSQPYADVSFPTDLFTSPPVVEMSHHSNTEGWFSSTSVTKDYIDNLYLLRPATANAGATSVSINAKGTWK